MKPKLTFTIDRSKWRCGGDKAKYSKGSGSTNLLNNDGYKCCLGFACLAAGLKEKDILGFGSPRCVLWKIPEAESKIIHLADNPFTDSTFSRGAMRINDDPGLNAQEREEQLIQLGRTMQIDISFTGEY